MKENFLNFDYEGLDTRKRIPQTKNSNEIFNSLSENSDEFFISDVLDSLVKRRTSDFKELNDSLFFSEESKKLLKEYEKIYRKSSHNYFDGSFNQIDNKLAILLILSNWWTAITDYNLWIDVTEDEIKKWIPEFQEKWNSTFFNIDIENHWEIKCEYEIIWNRIRIAIKNK